MATATHKLTDSIRGFPPRLLDFFVKYPPQQFGAAFTGQSIPTMKQKIAREGNKKTGEAPTEDAPSPIEVAQSAATTNTSASAAESLTPLPSTTTETLPPNPFLPSRNFATGRWHSPKYGLRRQAELCKLARAHGVEELLPPSRKSSTFKQARALERGLAVKGTGAGERVKGHKWERQMPGRVQKMTTAMEGMDELIREWKLRGHGRGWKKYPK